MLAYCNASVFVVMRQYLYFCASKLRVLAYCLERAAVEVHLLEAVERDAYAACEHELLNVLRQ